MLRPHILYHAVMEFSNMTHMLRYQFDQCFLCYRAHTFEEDRRTMHNFAPVYVMLLVTR